VGLPQTRKRLSSKEEATFVGEEVLVFLVVVFLGEAGTEDFVPVNMAAISSESG
jgi:hypothetical protein